MFEQIKDSFPSGPDPITHRLQGKRALVTGATTGIGREVAKELAKHNVRVIAVGRTESQLQSLEQEQAGIEGISTDISRLDDVQSLFRKMGFIPDIVVNNAARGHNNGLHEMNDEQLHGVVNTNLMGTLYVTREALKDMIERNSGQLVFVSSLAGKMGFPNLSVYSATKFGIEGFVDALREEIKQTGIHAMIVRPGVTDTDFFDTAGMNGFAEQMKHKMQSPTQTAVEIVEGIAQKKKELTIGPDKRFLPFLKHLPGSWARKLLPYIS